MQNENGNGAGFDPEYEVINGNLDDFERRIENCRELRRKFWVSEIFQHEVAAFQHRHHDWQVRYKLVQSYSSIVVGGSSSCVVMAWFDPK